MSYPFTEPAASPLVIKRSSPKNSAIIGTVAITAPAMRCWRGISELFSIDTPRVRMNFDGSFQ